MAAKNATGFSYGDDVFLIDCVRANRVLYDSTHDRRDDGPFKEYVWTEISTKVGKSVNQCKKRWKNIKNSYIKNKKKLGPGSTVMSNHKWSLFSHVSFIDTNELEQNSLGVRKSEKKDKLGKYINNNEPTHGNEMTSSSKDTKSCSSTEKKSYSNEDRIAIILAKGLKERNAMLYNNLQKQIEILDNTSFTVTIQCEQNTTSSIQNDDDKLEGKINDESVHDEPISSQLSSNAISSYLVEKLAQSKERNTILNNLQKQIEMLSSKFETTKSLDLFFKSILADIENFSPRAIDDVKPRILKCVSEVREMYSTRNSDAPLENPSCSMAADKFNRTEERNSILTNLQNQIAILDNKLETNNSMDLFFKSISVDLEDFCIGAIDDVKLRILECVTVVKEIYSNSEVSSTTSSNGHLTPNYLSSQTPTIDLTNTPESPPQGYITYYNVPYYSNQSSNYIQTYF